MPHDIATVEADLTEYADYAAVDSLARAKLFETAANRWLILRAETASDQAKSLSMGKSHVENMLHRVQKFIAYRSTANTGAAGVRFLSVGSSFR